MHTYLNMEKFKPHQTQPELRRTNLNPTEHIPNPSIMNDEPNRIHHELVNIRLPFRNNNLTFQNQWHRGRPPRTLSTKQISANYKVILKIKFSGVFSPKNCHAKYFIFIVISGCKRWAQITAPKNTDTRLSLIRTDLILPELTLTLTVNNLTKTIFL